MKNLACALVFFASSANAATPWEDYLDEPTSANAALVTDISYSAAVAGGYYAHDLAILNIQVLAADPQAFRLAFRLYEKSDGGLAEELGAILAGVIRANPEFFLRQVKVLDRRCSDFQWIVNTAGLVYVDRPKARAYEIEKRKFALQSIADSSLFRLRDECASQL